MAEAQGLGSCQCGFESHPKYQMTWPVQPPFSLISREEIWPGEIPTSSGGSVRPLVQQPAPFFTVHYTGSPGEWADFDDTTSEAAALQMYAEHAKKPWEYNWIVDTQGNVVEYAGLHRAAHSAGENGISHGVLLFLGIGEEMTDAMILALRQLNWWLYECDYLLNVGPTKHKDMPGAATICPGPKVEDRWDELSKPWGEMKKTIVVARFAGTADQFEVSSLGNAEAKARVGLAGVEPIILPVLSSEKRKEIEDELGYKLTDI